MVNGGRNQTLCHINGPTTFLERERPANAYYVKVKMQGVELEALVDSGAAITMILEDLFNSLKDVELISNGGGRSEFEGVVPGTKLHMKGSINVPLQIGSFTSPPHEIRIVADSNHSCIIGLDYLDRFYISIDTNGRQLRVALFTLH